MGWLRLALQNWLPKAVKSSGAVSPATRAKASMQPVMTPGDAVLRVIGEHRAPVGHAEAERRFADGVRHHEQHLFGGAGDGGNHHDAQSDAAGERGEVLLRQDDERVDGDAHHDGGHAVEHVGGKADDVGQLAAASELGEKDAGCDADGNTDARCRHASRTPEPTMALAMPPPVSPTGLGILVKKAKLSELAPL